MRRATLTLIALLALAACEDKPAIDPKARQRLQLNDDRPDPDPPEAAGSFRSSVAGLEAVPLAGPAQFCQQGGTFSLTLLDGRRGAGYLLERQGGRPEPGTYPVAASMFRNPGAFRGTVSLVPEGQQEADFFTVTGGELVLASADSGRVEGSFRIEVRSSELPELHGDSLPPEDAGPVTTATVTGSFQATERCLIPG